MDDEKKDQKKAEKNKVNPRVQRVQPYPIPCSLVRAEGTPALSVQIIRLAEIGFIFRAIGTFFRLSEEFTCDFEIPVLRAKIREPVKIIKTYESVEAYLPNGKKEKVMTVEVHFKNISKESRTTIRNFMIKIGQKLT